MSAPVIKLKIRTVKGVVCDVELATDKTILDVKKSIEATYQHPVSWQRLIFSGKVLEDEKTIAEYNLQADKMVIVYLKDPAVAKPTAAAPATTTPATPAATTTAAQTPSAPARTTGTTVAQTPASPTAPARAATGSVNNTTLSDEEFAAAVQNLVDMAFDRADATRALNAAYGDSARAVEYILSGNIPNINNGPRAGPPPVAAAGGAHGEGLDEATGGAFGRLRQLPQFQALIALIQQNPAMLEPLLQQLSERDPEIVRLIHENRDEFLQILQQRFDPSVLQHLAAQAEGEEFEELDEEEEIAAQLAAQGGAGAAVGLPPGTQVIQITPAEKEAIDRLVDLGFERNRALEAFLVCNRDEEMAANYLFEQEDN